MVPSKDLPKPLDYQNDKGDRSILCSNEVTVHRPLNRFRVRVAHQENQALIRGLELPT